MLQTVLKHSLGCLRYKSLLQRLDLSFRLTLVKIVS